jgi:hypothetical protein
MVPVGQLRKQRNDVRKHFVEFIASVSLSINVCLGGSPTPTLRAAAHQLRQDKHQDMRQRRSLASFVIKTGVRTPK